MSDIAVSIICNAYNHEKYIRDALDSFVAQRTDFDFEILVHDDASTDNTAKIIREYAKKYPDIIKPIYQQVNQYSKNPDIVTAIQNERAEGRYIALCEGDDYWTSPYKLQKQYDEMEKHPEIDICTHKALSVGFDTKKHINYIAPSEKNEVFTVCQVISGGGGFVATSSIMYRSELNSNIPDYIRNYGYDYALQIYSSMRGGMLYLADCMSAYRVMTPNSWTENTYSSCQKLTEHVEGLINFLSVLNEKTDYLYDKVIKDKILYEKFNLTRFKRNFKELKQGEFKQIYHSLCFTERMYIDVGMYIPGLLTVLRKIKKRLKG